MEWNLSGRNSDPNNSDVSRLTVAKNAIVVADRDQGKLELHLSEGSMHESSISDAGNYTLSIFGQRDLTVPVVDESAPHSLAPTNAELPLSALLAKTGADARAAKIEIHRRLVFPFACLALPLMALPLAARPRRGSRSGGFLLALVLICGYYVIFTVGAGLARDGMLPAWLGIWAANIAAATAGLRHVAGNQQNAPNADWLAASWTAFPSAGRDAGRGRNLRTGNIAG